MNLSCQNLGVRLEFRASFTLSHEERALSLKLIFGDALVIDRVRDHYSQYVLAISVFAQFKKFINVAGLANRIIKKQCCIFSSNNVIYVKKQSTSEAKENKSTRKIDEISTRIQAEFTGIGHNCDNNFNLTIWQNERSW